MGTIKRPTALFEQVKIYDYEDLLPESGERFYLYIIRYPQLQLYVWDYQNDDYEEYMASAANVLFYTSTDDFPDTGQEDKLYVDKTEPSISVWNNSSYDKISGGGSSGGVLKYTLQTVTDASTITMNVENGNRMEVVIAGDRTIAAPINCEAGQLIRIRIEQGTGGDHSVVWDDVFRKSTYYAPLSDIEGEIDEFEFIIYSVNSSGTATRIELVNVNYDV